MKSKKKFNTNASRLLKAVFGAILLITITLSIVITSCENKEDVYQETNFDKSSLGSNFIYNYSVVSIDFISSNGEPYMAKRFVISDGTFFKEFENIYSIKNLKVPNKCSYRFVWHSGIYDTQDQVTISLEPSEEYSFNFYCLDRNKTKHQIEPYILFEEKGANAQLKYEWNSSKEELTYSIQGEPGKKVDVVTWIDTELFKLPNYGLTSVKTENAIGGDASVCFPPNINFTISWDFVAARNDNSAKLKFEKIPDNFTFVGIREALSNNYILPDPSNGLAKKEIELTDLKGNLIESKYIYPQFAVPEGIYILTPKYINGNFISPSIPVKVELFKASIFEYYPLSVDNLKDYSFNILAEYYHTRTIVNEVENSKNLISISAEPIQEFATEYSNYYYGTFVLPSDKKINSISYYNEGVKTKLTEKNNYLISSQKGKTIVSVRIPYNIEKLQLIYE